MQSSSKEYFPAYCIPKVVRQKTGEVLYEKAYMSPRPPPKISLRHDWTKELGSKVGRQPEDEIDRQPGEEVAQQAKFFQPAQPIPNPIRDRSGQPDITEDVTSVQTCSSDNSKSVRLSRLMIGQGNLINTPLQYKTNLKYIMRPKRSTPTMRQFVKELRKTWTSKFQDYHIRL